jgi:hypothetical protein
MPGAPPAEVPSPPPAGEDTSEGTQNGL